jgi:hypothetical protein
VADAKRPTGLQLLVADSGRTWVVTYGQLRKLPHDALELGDVLVVRHETESGVMVLQSVGKNARGSWDLQPLQLAKAEST